MRNHLACLRDQSSALFAGMEVCRDARTEKTGRIPINKKWFDLICLFGQDASGETLAHWLEWQMRSDKKLSIGIRPLVRIILPFPVILGENPAMPEICSFKGIRITMYFDDHLPPHFHTEYGEHEAFVRIADGQLDVGFLPAGQMKLVRKWAAARRAELLANWQRAAANNPPLSKIAPLD